MRTKQNQLGDFIYHNSFFLKKRINIIHNYNALIRFV